MAAVCWPSFAEHATLSSRLTRKKTLEFGKINEDLGSHFLQEPGGTTEDFAPAQSRAIGKVRPQLLTRQA
jgi:hypothetical protein